MKSGIITFILSFLILISACSQKNQKQQVKYPSGEEFSVGEPETILTYKQRQEKGIGWIDTGIYAMNDEGQWKWFCGGGYKYGIGPKNNPYDSAITGYIDDIPEPRPESKSWEEIHHSVNNHWIANVYRNPRNGHILGFVHLEYKYEGNRRQTYFRFGLSISKDGGETFKWCGYIIKPELSFETWVNALYQNDMLIQNNVGLANYIIKDEYFYLYYQDTRDHPDTTINGAAVVRAKVEDVLREAEEFKTAEWKKYYKGKWNEKGLGGKFTPLNIEPMGFMHGDAAYNSYLDKYVLVTRTGKHTGPNGRPGKTSSILISFSSDGLHWSEWQTIHEDNHLHDYPSIISRGADNEVTGKSFWVYYEYRGGPILLPEKGKRSDFGWDRVLVTLDKE